MLQSINLSRAISYPRVMVILSVVLLLTASCRKNDSGTLTSTSTMRTAPPAPPKPDSLTQYVFTLDSTGTPTPGIILAAPLNITTPADLPATGQLLIMDQSGNVLKEQTTPGSAFGFTRWTIGGQTRYSYVMNDPNAFRTDGQDQNAGYAVVTDSNLNSIETFNFIPYAGDSSFLPGQSLDIHDFILISDNHYIDLSYVVKHVNNIPAYLHPSPKIQVVAPIIEEVNNGSVVWHWDGSMDTSFYANSVTTNDFTDSTAAQDYMHMNSLFIDPRDNNLICSMRNQDQVMKLNRTTGAVMWRLGGTNSDFPMDPGQAFLLQHHATLTDNNQTLLIYDDGSPARPTSRIVEFQLDEANKKINSFKSLILPETWSPAMGSVQKMGNEYFISGGATDYMLEINYVTGQKVMEYKGTLPTYRAFKY